MKRNLVLVCFLFLGVCSFAQIPNLAEMNFDAERKKMSLVTEGKTIPDAMLTMPDNTQISTEDFRGSYLVIDFWATWCAPCIEEAPIYKRKAKKYKDKNVKFIAVSVDQDIDSWKRFISKRNWSEDQYWFGNKTQEPFLALAYSETRMNKQTLIAITLPKYIIISPTGEILSNSGIRPSKPDFERELRKHL